MPQEGKQYLQLNDFQIPSIDPKKVNKNLLKLCKDPIIGFSNQLFAFFSDNNGHDRSIPILNIYIPTYTRIKIKNIKKVQISELNAELNINIIVTIKKSGLCDHYVKLIKDKITLSFRRDSPIILKEGKNSQLVISQDKENKEITFLVRKIVSTRVDPFIFLTPLEVLDLILSISINPISTLIKNDQNQIDHYLKFHFNFMKPYINYTNENIFISMSFVKKLSFASYKIAQRRLVAEYTSNQYPSNLKSLGKNFYNFKVCECSTKVRLDEKKLNAILNSKKKIDQLQRSIQLPACFNYSHFHVPLYKQPIVPVLVIYFPLIILGILNVTIFFQAPEQLADRLANIATILIALVGMINIVREQIPPNPAITFTEIMVILESIGALLCLLSTVLIRAKEDGSDPYDVYRDPTFAIATALVALMILFPLIILFSYVCCLRKSHQIPFNQDATEKVNFNCFWNFNQQADKLYYGLYQDMKQVSNRPQYQESNRKFETINSNIQNKYLKKIQKKTFKVREQKINKKQRNPGYMIMRNQQSKITCALFFQFSGNQNRNQRQQLIFQSIKNNNQIQELSKNLNMVQYRFKDAQRKCIQDKMRQISNINSQRFQAMIKELLENSKIKMVKK